jgi:hypothetical protein
MSTEIITYSDNINAAELEAPALDPQYLLIANEYLAGKSIDTISSTYNLSPDRVAAICERSDTKRYIDTVIMTQGYLHRARRLRLINKVIDKKLEEAEETDIYSKKDLLDWIKLLNDIDKQQAPKVATTAVQVNQTNNYTTLMQDLLGDK